MHARLGFAVRLSAELLTKPKIRNHEQCQLAMSNTISFFDINLFTYEDKPLTLLDDF